MPTRPPNPIEPSQHGERRRLRLRRPSIVPLGREEAQEAVQLLADLFAQVAAQHGAGEAAAVEARDDQAPR
jgi:hypothetical protein